MARLAMALGHGILFIPEVSATRGKPALCIFSRIQKSHKPEFSVSEKYPPFSPTPPHDTPQPAANSRPLSFVAMTSKQRSAKQRKSRTSAETSDRREAMLDASKVARRNAYESKRVWANADPTGGRKNKSRLMVTITVTFYPDDRGSCDFMFTENSHKEHMDGIAGFSETCALKQGAVAYFDGVINHRGRHSTGRTTGAQERLVLVIRAAVNTNYADAEKSFKAQGGA